MNPIQLLRYVGILCVLSSVTIARAETREGETSSDAGSFQGSRSSDVYFDDMTYTLRLTFFTRLAISPHDPNTAYVASWDGYVFKTTDGGKTWDESRLIVEPRGFYGDAWQRLYFGVHRSGGFSSPSGGSQEELPLNGSLARMRPFNTMGGDYPRVNLSTESQFQFDEIRPGSGGRAGAAANTNFGVGLPGGAPRLQNVVRNFGKPTSGLNIKQTLYFRGNRPTEIKMIIVHPKNPNIVFACTMFGLYMSNDGGLNWMRTFVGENSESRKAFHLAVDPSDDRRVLLATGNGLYLSTDGGNNFTKATGQGVGEGILDWIYFYPYDSRYVFACTNSGLLRSKDRGNNWEWIYFTTFPPARVVRHMTVDPFDRKVAYIGTHDGMFMTRDVLTGSLDDWRRVGGGEMTGLFTTRISACPKHKGHLWTLTRLTMRTVNGWQEAGGAYIWETLDGGATWKIIFSGETKGEIQWFENDPHDPDLLWTVWSRALARMKRVSPNEVDRQTLSTKTEQKLEALFKHYPSVSDAVLAAVRYTGGDPGIMLKYRRRAMLKAFVPRLDVSYTAQALNRFPVLDDGLYSVLPYRRRVSIEAKVHDFQVMLMWDLSDSVFNLNAWLFGRVDRLNQELHHTVAIQVHRFYAELLRLKSMMIVKPPDDLRVRITYKLRIEELEAWMNMLTGGYLEYYKKHGKGSGLDAKLFTDWPGTHPWPKENRQ